MKFGKETRDGLRRFWDKLLTDLEWGHVISDERADTAIEYASIWST